MWWIIDLVEFILKVVLSCHVIIFLRKIYDIACNMANTQKVLDEALADLGLDDDDDVKPSETNRHREILIGLSQSGLLQKIGIKKTESELGSMTDADVDKVFNEYQRRYTACVSDDVVNNILYGYAAFFKWLSPNTEKAKLADELKDNFVIGAEIKKQLGRFGLALSPWLAVVNTAVITAKNVDLSFAPEEPKTDESTSTFD